MWSFVRRLWPFHRASSAYEGSYSAPSSGGRWWWPGDWLRRSNSVIPDAAAEPTRFVVVHPGGAVLRASASINSAKVGSLRRGEVVPIVKEDGRRACVKVPDSQGARAWISTVTAEGMPVVRRVTASTKYKDMPHEGTSAFADAFEAKWQEKWERLRVEADRKEARPHSVRGSLPGMPINSWRPTGKYLEGTGAAKLRSRARLREEPPQTVPKLEQPASARTGLSVFSHAVYPEADDMVPLMSMHEEDLPDLIGFDTWPQRNGVSSKVPSLAELLGGQGKAPLAPGRTADSDLIEDSEDLGKEALVFLTEPSPSTSRSRRLVSGMPPTRDVSLVNAVEKPFGMGLDGFEYLLDSIEQDTSEGAGENSPAQPRDATAPSSEGLADGGGDELSADEVLRVLAAAPEPDAPESPARDDSTKQGAGFQLDPLQRAWAKRSARKVPLQFPRRANRSLQEFLDVEQAADEGERRTGQTEKQSPGEELVKDELVGEKAESLGDKAGAQEETTSHREASPPPRSAPVDLRSELESSPLSQASLLDLATVPSAPSVTQTGDVADLALHPFFDVSRQDSAQVKSSQASRNSLPLVHRPMPDRSVAQASSQLEDNLVGGVPAVALHPFSDAGRTESDKVKSFQASRDDTPPLHSHGVTDGSVTKTSQQLEDGLVGDVPDLALHPFFNASGQDVAQVKTSKASNDDSSSHHRQDSLDAGVSQRSPELRTEFGSDVPDLALHPFFDAGSQAVARVKSSKASEDHSLSHHRQDVLDSNVVHNSQELQTDLATEVPDLALHPFFDSCRANQDHCGRTTETVTTESHGHTFEERHAGPSQGHLLEDVPDISLSTVPNRMQESPILQRDLLSPSMLPADLV